MQTEMGSSISMTKEIKDQQQLKTTKYQQIIVKANDYED